MPRSQKLILSASCLLIVIAAGFLLVNECAYGSGMAAWHKETLNLQVGDFVIWVEADAWQDHATGIRGVETVPEQLGPEILETQAAGLRAIAEGEGGLSKDEWDTFFNLKQFAANFRALFFTFGQPEFGQSHFALLDQEP